MLTIKQEHIDSGKRNDGFRSPVSLALLDEGYLESYTKLTVGLVKGQRLGWLRYRLPDELRAWLIRYNNGENVEPISVELPTKVRMRQESPNLLIEEVLRTL